MKYKKSKATLFLMELIIAICFFAITSAVCVQVFVKAHIVSEKTTDLNHAIAQTQSMAEAFMACGGDKDALLKLFPTALDDGNRLKVYYDEGWQPCAAAGDYTLTITMDGLDSPNEVSDEAASGHNGYLVTAQIDVVKAGDNSCIYSLTAKKYVKGD